jgi:hypothetical protein
MSDAGFDLTCLCILKTKEVHGLQKFRDGIFAERPRTVRVDGPRRKRTATFEEKQKAKAKKDEERRIKKQKKK